MEQFRLEVAVDGTGYQFNIKAAGEETYEIYKEEELVGTLELDEDNHEHCNAHDCELDMPLINALREGIHAYLNRN
jgi:hypothetical protein